MNRTNSTSRVVLAGLMAALTCVATMIIEVPSPMTGYVNLGDGVVLLCGFLLGPAWGAAAAGIGSMLADIFSGYAYYAPGTLLIKAAVAMIGGLVYHRLKSTDRPGLPGAVLGGILGEAVMVLGYFGYASLILGFGLAATASIPGNLVQGVFGVVISTVLISVLASAPVVREAVYVQQK